MEMVVNPFSPVRRERLSTVPVLLEIAARHFATISTGLAASEERSAEAASWK